MKRRALGMLVCLLLGACGERTIRSDGGIFFPTQASPDVPNAQAFGTLVRLRDCILLRQSAPGSDLLLLWPEGFSFQRGKVLEGDTPVAKMGDRVQVGGGEVSPEVATELAGQEIPSSCADPTPWIMSDIEVLGPSD
jgi:hypothetical protein